LETEFLGQFLDRVSSNSLKRSEEWVQFNRIGDLRRTGRETYHSLHLHTMRKGHVRTARRELFAREKNPTRNQISQHLSLRLSASRGMRNKFLLYESPSLEYLVVSA
jgi:hypothetical protein